MKNRQSKNGFVLTGMIAAAIICGGGLLYAAANGSNVTEKQSIQANSNQESIQQAVATIDGNQSTEEALQEAIVGASNTACGLGSYTSDDGTLSALTSDQIDAEIARYNEQVDRYYAASNPQREYYKSQNEYVLTQAEHPYVEYTVDIGAEKPDIQSIEMNRDETEATVQYTNVVWGIWVQEVQDDSGNYSIIAPVNKETVSAIYVKEDGVWKLSQTLQSDLDMGKEDSEKALSATYSSFSDALSAAQSMDIAECNPF